MGIKLLHKLRSITDEALKQDLASAKNSSGALGPGLELSLFSKYSVFPYNKLSGYSMDRKKQPCFVPPVLR